MYSTLFVLQHNSDLLALIQVMIVTFGEQPPVYAKSRSEVQQSSTPYPVQRKYTYITTNFYFNVIYLSLTM